ncbi:MAG: hypothetical protein AAGA23_17065 [Pseudomonadota bacterium]
MVPGDVSLAAFVAAFYTTWLFKLERRILTRFLRRPSTDEDARAVARGERDTFSAWTVEDRSDNQLLMQDVQGRTRSWFMVTGAAGGATRLRFGSAVLPVDKPGGGLGLSFRLLLGFHKLYSRALLTLASRRVVQPPAAG